tara:strand:- start:1474 stop:1824 length:351 start_codon:yes stop_codon:yes gene_type:complete
MPPSADQTLTANLPAPKTFAPSREDVLSTLAFFFGDPATPEKLKDYSEQNAMTYHFPDAFYGQNTKIRETLNNLILKVHMAFRALMPRPHLCSPVHARVSVRSRPKSGRPGSRCPL